MSEGNKEQAETDVWHDVPTLLAAAHELKSPLVLIRQLSLELQQAASSPEQMGQLHSQIRLTAERSLQLVEGLTKAARLEDTLFDLEPINISELYASVVEEMNPLALSLDQRFTVNVPTKTPNVMASRSLLRSVLIGLCDNALTHNDVHHAVELRTSSLPDSRIELSVRDFGAASSEKLNIIKQRLGRSPQVMAKRPRSSGLGLLIADQFARYMGSQLDMTRHRGQGVSFSVILPRSTQLSMFEIM